MRCSIRMLQSLSVRAFVLLVLASRYQAVAGDQMTDLYNQLFNGYRTSVVPVCQSSLPVDVYFDMSLRQIIELDEPKQILKVNLWIRMFWTDCRLTWNSTQYNGVSYLNIPFNDVWVPDITLYDSAEAEIHGWKDYRVAVQSDGTASYYAPLVLSVMCKMDVTLFPFDTQTCPFKFSSWSYDGTQINLLNSSKEGDVSSFLENSEWNKPSVPMKRNVVYYSCCTAPYPDITFNVTMSRKSLFYVLNLLYPCMLITALAFLGFMLPPDAGEKVSLEITVLLSLAVFMLVVSESLPPTSETFPYIGVYFACSMLLSCFSTVLTVVVLNVHFRGLLGSRVPPRLRRFCLGFLARLVCVNTHVDGRAQVRDGQLQEVETHNQNSTNNKPDDNSINNNHVKTTPEPVTETSATSKGKPSKANMLRVLKEQLSLMQKSDQRQENKEKEDQLLSEWYTVAIVLDRFFLVLFLIIAVIITLATLLQCLNS